MSEQISYKEKLKKDLNELIDSLAELSDSQTHCLRSRWLDQVLWLETAAKRNRLAYATLRLTAIISGIIVPALVSAGVQNGNDENQLLRLTSATHVTLCEDHW